jgi:inosine-uridine nucleoside N-ribohydrolase
MKILRLLYFLALASSLACAQKRLVLIDQDGSGPGGSNQMAILSLLQAPQIEVLGITMVTGNAWRDEETAHTLRMLELTGHANVPLAKGAVFPLVRTQQEAQLTAAIDGKVTWLGAWGQGPSTLVETAHGVTPVTPDNLQAHGPYEIPPLPEGLPTLKPIEEDAVHFLIRQVHEHPHQVTIYAAGPMTNIALAISIDSEFAALTQGIVLMGSSLNPQTDDPEFATDPRHEFNFWFDPEAVHIVLRAHWPHIDLTTVDISIKTHFTKEMVAEIAHSSAPAAQYITKYSSEFQYLWDELAAAAWIDPKIITKEHVLYMDVDLSHGANYGDALTWTDVNKPQRDLQPVHVQEDLDSPRFNKLFLQLMMAAPHAP